MNEDASRDSRECANKLTRAAVLALLVSVLSVVAAWATIVLTGAFSWDAFAIACVGGWSALFAMVVSLELGVLAWRREGRRTDTPKILVWIVVTVLVIAAVIAFLKLTPPGI